MAQGRGNAYAASMLLLIIVSLQSCSLWRQVSAAIHTVGGSKGWTVGVDYTSWATGQTFNVGDILFFPYVQAEHNVAVVDKAGYDACSGANTGSTYSDGNTNVTLTAAGSHYYLCSFIAHCSAGMKLTVTATATATPPQSHVAAPTASPPTSAPAPSKATPSAAPSPTKTPSSSPTPAPTPRVETPVPAPVPAPSLGPAPVPTSASSPSAPGSNTPSSAGTPPSSPPPPPNAAPSLCVPAALAPLLALWAALLAL